MIMSETTPSATAAQAETTLASIDQVEDQTKPQATPSTLMPTVALIVRLVSLASLVVSLSVMASNSEKLDSRTTVHFNDIYSYRYVVATCVIGMVYTLLQSSLLIYEVGSGKKIYDHPFPRVIFEFIGDKVILCLLATAVGAAFGATLDLKSKADELEDALEDYVGFGSPSLAKLDDFLTRAYIPTIFLLIAFLTCGVSSVLSSLALAKKTP